MRKGTVNTRKMSAFAVQYESARLTLFSSVSPVDGETSVKPFPCFSLPPVDIQNGKNDLADSGSRDFAMLARVTVVLREE